MIEFGMWDANFIVELRLLGTGESYGSPSKSWIVQGGGLSNAESLLEWSCCCNLDMEKSRTSKFRRLDEFKLNPISFHLHRIVMHNESIALWWFLSLCQVCNPQYAVICIWRFSIIRCRYFCHFYFWKKFHSFRVMYATQVL